MASFEIPYLLLLSLTPVYFCKLKVSGELHFSDHEFVGFWVVLFFGFFFKRRGGRKEKSCACPDTQAREGILDKLCAGLYTPLQRQSLPWLQDEPAGPSVPPNARSRGAPTCASAERPAAQPRRRQRSPGPKRPFPGTGGFFFNRGI